MVKPVRKTRTAAKKTEKLHVYAWEGKDKSGKETKGEISASSEIIAKSLLRRQGAVPKKIKKKSQGLFGAGGGKISSKDVSAFTRQMSTMQAAGMPVVQSIEMVATSHEKAEMRRVLLDVKSQVEGGSNIADSFRKYPNHFSGLYCNLVEAGEKAGILESILKRLAEYLEKTESMKAKVKKAMIYPAAVLIVAGVVTVIIMIFVIPQFEETFKSFGATLPALTVLIINMSKFFQSYWWAVGGALIGGVYGFVAFYKKSKPLQRGIDRWMLQIPAFGDIFRKASVARFARTMSTMFAAGTPIVEAMNSVAGATGNYVYESATYKMRDDISTGMPLNVSMKNTDLFAPLTVQMVAIGEEAGSLDSMLGKVADIYEEEVDIAVDGIATLIEPIMIVVLGGIVGTIVIAMYLPIFKLGSTV